jgi:hypothetical protein
MLMRRFYPQYSHLVGRFQFLEVLELIEYIMLSVVEYPNVIKELSRLL